MSKPLSKIKHQIKSGKYYIFWGACTLAVMTGQIYVGAGYRQMSKSLDAWFDKTISIMIQKRLMQERPSIDPYIYRDREDGMPIIQ
tara:strand:+ start:1338 stop:1595 length:258 start_codon:yes stop_codon:yes gene_type:complete